MGRWELGTQCLSRVRGSEDFGSMGRVAPGRDVEGPGSGGNGGGLGGELGQKAAQPKDSFLSQRTRRGHWTGDHSRGG